MTAKKPESEKKSSPEKRAKQSIGGIRTNARKRAAVATYTDDETGEHFIGGMKVSDAMWAAFISENPQFAAEGEVLERSSGAETVTVVAETFVESDLTCSVEGCSYKVNHPGSHSNSPILEAPVPPSVPSWEDNIVLTDPGNPPATRTYNPEVEEAEMRVLVESTTETLTYTGDGVPAADAEGMMTYRHEHKDLGREGITHAHQGGGYPHTHDESLGNVVGLPPRVLGRVQPSDRALDDKSDEEKDREHKAAMEAARQADQEAKVQFPSITDGDDADVVVHVLLDGFTVLGKVWYRGETISVKRGSRLWDIQVDRFGNATLDMGPAEQEARFGTLAFAPGPWPGEKAPMTEAEYLAALAEDDQEAIKRWEGQSKEASRGPIRVGGVRVVR